ncbi:uncharacterized protein LOC101850396 [Aplysia californica]|uniref:Uncharacterized protein LOC101850396 n=1 Tax=Aplysia californica TaxID=6500 RepID=A0ABM1W585_APLCA|nr:uncharacterized protein LOC101850396 [Aplysia californica]
MAETADSSGRRVLEFDCLSGLVCVTLDQQCVLTQRFERQVRVSVTLDKLSLFTTVEKSDQTQAKGVPWDEDISGLPDSAGLDDPDTSDLKSSDTGCRAGKLENGMTVSSEDLVVENGDGNRNCDSVQGEEGSQSQMLPRANVGELHDPTGLEGERNDGAGGKPKRQANPSRRKRKNDREEKSGSTAKCRKRSIKPSVLTVEEGGADGDSLSTNTRKGSLVVKIKREKVFKDNCVPEPGDKETVSGDGNGPLRGAVLNQSHVNGKKKKVKKWAVEKDVWCEFCHLTFKSQQAFFDHRKANRTELNCKLCGKVMPFRAHLMVHMHKHNRSMLDQLAVSDADTSQLVLTSSTSNSASQEEEGGSEELHSKRGVKGVKCDVCSVVVSNIPILKTHMMTHTGEMAYRCCVCQEETHSIARFNNHMMSHAKGGQVQCKVCNLFFPSRADLCKHQLSHEFKCSLCGRGFPNKTSRAFHYKMAHKEDILKCSVCGKLFSCPDELQAHLNYHRNRTKTQCPICGLFVFRLEYHMISHSERAEDVSMYTCGKCQKKFKQKLSYQRHLHTHTGDKPYACMECPKKFARSSGLRRHMLTHSQEKPFVCDICGKACSQMGNLRIHMQIHKAGGVSGGVSGGVATAQCPLCDQSFPHKHSLQEHMNSAHYAKLSAVETTPYMPPTANPLSESAHTMAHTFYSLRDSAAAAAVMALPTEKDFLFEKFEVRGTVSVTIDDDPPVLIYFKTRVKMEVNMEDLTGTDPAVHRDGVAVAQTTDSGDAEDFEREHLDEQNEEGGDLLCGLEESGDSSQDKISLSNQTDGMVLMDSRQATSDVTEVGRAMSDMMQTGRATIEGEQVTCGVMEAAQAACSVKEAGKAMTELVLSVEDNGPAGGRVWKDSSCSVSEQVADPVVGGHADVAVGATVSSVADVTASATVSSAKAMGVVKREAVQGRRRSHRMSQTAPIAGDVVSVVPARSVTRAHSLRTDGQDRAKTAAALRPRKRQREGVEEMNEGVKKRSEIVKERREGVKERRIETKRKVVATKKKVSSCDVVEKKRSKLSKSVAGVSLKTSSKRKSTPSSSPSGSFSFLSVFQTSPIKTKIKKTEKHHLKQDKPGEKKVVSSSAVGAKVATDEVKCGFCLRVFPSQSAYQDHTKTPRSGIYPCSMCARTFPFKAFKQAHEKTFHASSHSGQESTLKEAVTFSCHVCGVRLKRMAAFKKHLMIHTEEFFYKCCMCSRQFLEPGSLRNHMSSHQSGGMLRCRCCDQLFATRGALAKHKLATMEIKCYLCGENFPNRTSRTQHYKRFHETEVLRCSKCQSMFSRAEDYAKHMREHNRYKKKQCTVCGKFFSRLELHVAVHKRPVEVEESSVYVCDKCPRKFTNRSSFQRHLSTHSEEKTYECPNCPRKFADCGVLRKHLRRHSTLMPYQCEVCGKRCRESGSLKLHMRVHAETKQFPCPVCPQAFNYKKSLESHMRTRHSQSLLAQDAAASTNSHVTSHVVTGDHKEVIGNSAGVHPPAFAEIEAKPLYPSLTFPSAGLEPTHTLRPVDLESTHTLRPLDLESNHTLQPVDIVSVHALRPVDLESHHPLKPIDIVSAHTLQPVDLESTHTLQPVDITSNHSLQTVEQLGSKPTVYAGVGSQLNALNPMSLSVPYCVPQVSPHLMVASQAQEVTSSVSADVPTVNVTLY